MHWRGLSTSVVSVIDVAVFFFVKIFYYHDVLWPIREKELQARGSDKEKSKVSCLLK